MGSFCSLLVLVFSALGSSAPTGTYSPSSSVATTSTTTGPRASLAPAVIGYLLLDPVTGPAKLQALAANATRLPLTRLVVSFARPDMVYIPQSRTLKHVGLGLATNTSSDYGFELLANATRQLQAGGVEVFLSVGGWNYNCFAFLYMKYSIAYFPVGPNAWKLSMYGLGSMSGCTEANQYCYVCEPPSEGTKLSDFSIFPEPSFSPTWKQAQAFVASGTGGDVPVWHPELVGGASFTDGSVTTTVPGSDLWSRVRRDPYQDLVYLAKDLNLDGIDLDYEEFWHADTFRSGTGLGPFRLDQTVYKYSAIAYDLILNIKATYPTCKLSVAASAAGAWNGPWWGGNLKGLWYFSNLWYPSITDFMMTGPNAGGINAMTYDLSKNPTFHECPSPTLPCSLAGQVAFYLDTYHTNISPSVRFGLEVGTPAYPDAMHDSVSQLPLTKQALNEITSSVSVLGGSGAIVWELYKDQGVADVNASVVLQTLCRGVFGGGMERCLGVIPRF
ncbi:hypothetical protein BCR33DRAFT_854053 [Rhizoclosmatium globosum]|uniref:Chitinase n=1 Tax=Rhizoclosmatium globosum TaxID=329046 RepID=A0A1Y2BUF9_9FUNG|nr:hypothetical protein BCR33DRAFT_854053 [Rhizoclosmatium globosum]|eukprot:ORY38391.1 hypothetical protein BCR33DRAFT_854053 [Rhizoclosmatium globosum]